VPTGQTVNRFTVGVRDPGAQVDFIHVIGPTSHGPFAGQDLFIASQQMELFVDPGKELVVYTISDSPKERALVFLSGHLVNLP
jgi:hypothetical protein